MHAQHPLGVRGFQPAVVDDAGVEGVLGRQHRHRLDVRGEQHALDRRPGRCGQSVQPVRQVGERHPGAVPLTGWCRVARPGRRECDGVVRGRHVLPELLVLLAGQRGQLGGDEVRVPHGGGGRVGLGGAGQRVAVAGDELHHQGVDGPSVGEGVRVGERQVPGLVRVQVGGEPEQRSLGQLEPGGALGRGEGPAVLGPLRLGAAAQVVHGERQLCGGVHQLERPGEPVEVHRGAQQLVPGRHRVDRGAQRLGRERLLARDPEGADVAVDRAVLGGQHLDQHAGLDLGERVGVDQVGGQQGPVLQVEQGERRHRRHQ